MTKAISNTSPLQYLYRANAIHWLPQLYEEIITPEAVRKELEEGNKRGYDVPSLTNYPWLQIINPKHTPSQWLSLDLGPGELAAMALGLENPSHILILDDMLARRTAQNSRFNCLGYIAGHTRSKISRFNR